MEERSNRWVEERSNRWVEKRNKDGGWIRNGGIEGSRPRWLDRRRKRWVDEVGMGGWVREGTAWWME